MAGVRANWHLSDLDLPQDDGQDIEALGVEIDLRSSPDELQATLVKLVQKESSFYNAGIRCDLKQEQDQSCYRCPQFTEDNENTLSCLCRLGREQEDTLHAMDRRTGIDRREFDELAEAARVPEFVELAEACGASV